MRRPLSFCPLSLVLSLVLCFRVRRNGPKAEAGPRSYRTDQSLLAHKIWGSGDPEVHDGKHCIDVFAKQYPDLANCGARLEQIMSRAKLSDGSWRHPNCISQIPLPPGPCEPAVEGWVHPWHLGISEVQAIRGNPKMVNVLEVSYSLLDNGFRSQNNPLCILFPARGKGRNGHPTLFY